MLAALQPREPVYCIHPEIYRTSTRAFLAGFPGRVLYAIKANNEPAVISLLHESGISHFDCASLPEIELAKRVCPDATCYFMNPVRIRGAAHDAQQQFGVRHFMIDDMSGLPPLLEEIDVSGTIIFVRMAASHHSAAEDLSVKFGADPDLAPDLLQAVTDAGAEAALAFNVGMYGALWELRCNGQNRYAVNSYRNSKALAGAEQPFRIFGPTCDSGDCLPEPLKLPADIDVGDYIEFQSVGAYSLSGRTDFNGFRDYTLVVIDD